MEKAELAKCPICKGEMQIDYQTDQDGERGYFVFCDKCNLYFGLDEDARDMGYLWGKYSEEGVKQAWNKLTGGSNNG